MKHPRKNKASNCQQICYPESTEDGHCVYLIYAHTVCMYIIYIYIYVLYIYRERERVHVHTITNIYIHTQCMCIYIYTLHMYQYYCMQYDAADQKMLMSWLDTLITPLGSMVSWTVQLLSAKIHCPLLSHNNAFQQLPVSSRSFLLVTEVILRADLPLVPVALTPPRESLILCSRCYDPCRSPHRDTSLFQE